MIQLSEELTRHSRDSRGGEFFRPIARPEKSEIELSASIQEAFLEMSPPVVKRHLLSPSRCGDGRKATLNVGTALHATEQRPISRHEKVTKTRMLNESSFLRDVITSEQSSTPPVAEQQVMTTEMTDINKWC